MELIAEQLQSNDVTYLPEMASTAKALRLAINDYSDRLQDVICELIEDGAEKESLTLLAASLVVQLEAENYSKQFVHYVTQKTLARELSAKKVASPKKAISKFFRFFRSEPDDYEVVFRGASDSRDLTLFPDIFLVDDINNFEKKDELHYPLLNEFILLNLQARDPVSARNSAVKQVKTWASISKFFSHGLSHELSERCIVRNKRTKKEIVVGPPVSAMLQGTERLTDEEVKEKMLGVARAMVKLDRQSQTRLVKALQYHKEAIDSQALENQLVDLWAALEGFVPQPFDDQPRIQHYISYLLPP